MSIPRPEHFQDWKSWAAEFIRRDAADPLAARVAKLLGTQGGISAEYIRQKDVIQLTSSDSVFATDVIGLDDFISDEIGGLLIEGAGIDLTQDSVTGAITIAATGGGVAVRDEGTTLTSSAGFLDFKGTGVTATTVSGGVQVSVPGASGGGNVDGRAHVVPTLTDFSWVNQGSTAANQRSYGIGMTQPAAASNQAGLLVRAAPSTPYTITARFKAAMHGIDYSQVGLVWRESTGGAFQFLRLLWNGGRLQVALTNFSSPTIPDSEQKGSTPIHPVPEWFRLTDNGTNRSVHFSCNGDDWNLFWTGSRTSFLTPNQVGFAINNQHSTSNLTAMMTLLSWEAA